MGLSPLAGSAVDGWYWGMTTNRRLGVGLIVLAGLIAGYVVLGPLVLGVIRFRTSGSGLNQIRGGDLAALFVVAPVCALIGRLAWRGHRRAPVLALAPALFAMYTYSQLVLGNEYLDRPGNVERAFPLLLAMFLLASVIAVHCWGAADRDQLPSLTRRLERGSGILLLVLAAFLVVGLHLPTLLPALRDPPTGAAYLDAPTAFWVVKFYDLGIVAPAAVAVGLGLLRGRSWAQKAAYGVLGGFVLLGWSVAGMAWVMWVSADPDASAVMVTAFTGIGLAGSTFAYFLYGPLFRSPEPGSDDGDESGGRDRG